MTGVKGTGEPQYQGITGGWGSSCGRYRLQGTVYCTYINKRQALFVVSVLTAKPVFVVSVLIAKPVYVVSMGLRVFQKNLKFTIFFQTGKWNYILLDA